MWFLIALHDAQERDLSGANYCPAMRANQTQRKRATRAAQRTQRQKMRHLGREINGFRATRINTLYKQE